MPPKKTTVGATRSKTVYLDEPILDAIEEAKKRAPSATESEIVRDFVAAGMGTEAARQLADLRHVVREQDRVIKDLHARLEEAQRAANELERLRKVAAGTLGMEERALTAKEVKLAAGVDLDVCMVVERMWGGLVGQAIREAAVIEARGETPLITGKVPGIAKELKDKVGSWSKLLQLCEAKLSASTEGEMQEVAKIGDGV